MHDLHDRSVKSQHLQTRDKSNMACSHKDCNEKASTFFHKRQGSDSMPTQKYWASTQVSAGKK